MASERHVLTGPQCQNQQAIPGEEQRPRGKRGVTVAQQEMGIAGTPRLEPRSRAHEL